MCTRQTIQLLLILVFGDSECLYGSTMAREIFIVPLGNINRKRFLFIMAKYITNLYDIKCKCMSMEYNKYIDE